jgi:hypothetical protein
MIRQALFQYQQGMRQGDPLSPILFYAVVDVLSILTDRAKEVGLIKGVFGNLITGGLVMLQYADDMIFLFEDFLESARNLKLILCFFEHLSGLKVTFHKSEVIYLGAAVERRVEYFHIFTCVEGKLLFKYLGFPVHNKGLRNNDWKPAEDKMEAKLHTWQGNILSYGGRLVLLRGCLSNVPLHILSFYEIPKVL